jgi:hypothetical protein
MEENEDTVYSAFIVFSFDTLMWLSFALSFLLSFLLCVCLSVLSVVEGFIRIKQHFFFLSSYIIYIIFVFECYFIRLQLKLYAII